MPTQKDLFVIYLFICKELCSMFHAAFDRQDSKAVGACFRRFAKLTMHTPSRNHF